MVIFNKISFILFCRVSGRLASISCARWNFLAERLNLLKQSFAPGCALNAAARSFGILSASTSSSMDQEPLAFAVVIHWSPAGVILPSAIKNLTFSLLILDHMLFGFRLVKSWMNLSSSSERRVLSIQPKHRASSTASLHLKSGCFLK